MKIYVAAAMLVGGDRYEPDTLLRLYTISAASKVDAAAQVAEVIYKERLSSDACWLEIQVLEVAGAGRFTTTRRSYLYKSQNNSPFERTDL